MTPRTLEDHRREHERTLREAAEAQARGRFALALELFSEALRHAEALGDRRKVHAAHINISSCLLSLGEHDEARQGLPAIILESDSPLHVSAAAAQLAEALMHEGRLDKAAHYLRMAGEQARLAGDRQREGWVLNVQGNLAIVSGRYADAIDSYQRSIDIFEAALAETIDVHGSIPGWADKTRATRLDNLGYAQVLAQHLGEGLRTLRRARVSARRADNTRLLAEIEKDLAFGFLLGHSNTAAERHALRALGLAQDNGYASVVQSSYYLLMELALRRSLGTDFDRWFDRLQATMPDVRLSRDFFRIFDLSDVVNLKEF
jgi:tetratricopeptide (TPR) repeat protein